MTIDDRARGFVQRADAAVADLGRAEEIWAESVGSTTGEMRLHSLSVALDNAIRKVDGTFEAWAGLDPSQVEAVSENGPKNLLWVVSAHPSGRVREAFVHQTMDLTDDHILPHLTNRTIDFVPAIRDLARPLVMARLAEALAERAEPDAPAVLPTAVHISVKKLLAPRTAILSPELIPMCIDLATTSSQSRPGRLKGDHFQRMLDRCGQTAASTEDPASREALDALVGFFNENVILG